VYSALACHRLIMPLLAIAHGPDKSDQAFPDLGLGADARCCKNQNRGQSRYAPILVGRGRLGEIRDMAIPHRKVA